MAATIAQRVVFKNTTTEILYNLYMDAKLHSLVTGAPAKISNKAGGEYKAYGDYMWGKNIYLVKNECIIQTWRAEDWNAKDADSIFMLNFEQKGSDVVLHVVHANIPDETKEDLSKGWHDYYWKPWKKYLSGKE